MKIIAINEWNERNKKIKIKKKTKKKTKNINSIRIESMACEPDANILFRDGIHQ